MSACINPSKLTNRNPTHAIHMMPMPNLDIKFTPGQWPLTYRLHRGTSKSWPQPLSAISQDHMMPLSSVWDAVEFQKTLMLMYISIFSFKMVKIGLFFLNVLLLKILTKIPFFDRRYLVSAHFQSPIFIKINPISTISWKIFLKTVAPIVSITLTSSITLILVLSISSKIFKIIPSCKKMNINRIKSLKFLCI